MAVRLSSFRKQTKTGKAHVESGEALLNTLHVVTTWFFQMQMLFSFLGKGKWRLDGCYIERVTSGNQESLWMFPLGAPEY